MGNNKINEGEDILVKVDVNNLIFIDPNSVLNGDKVEERGIKQENLVMYVNLEADLVPRSVLSADGGQVTSLTQIAKGTLNILQNKGPNGKDFDTSWTDVYVNQKTGESDLGDTSSQSFGIDSININIKGGNFIPQITINFIDVRGKTLFESPQNSPYGAFFHLPWPIFYLTVKGFYGKAIRYRLHMTKFSSRYNDSNGNFEITTTFVGSTYAYLNDIPLNGILNAPYMYMVESDEPAKFIESKGVQQKKIKKSSKGYIMLKSVYDEYKQKGLIDQNFPTRTLREVIVVARSLDKLLEKEIFGSLIDMKLFAGIAEYEAAIINFETAVKGWSKRFLGPEIDTINGVIHNRLASGINRLSTEHLYGADISNTLESIITNNVKKILSTKVFAQDFVQKAASDFKKETINFTNTIKPIKSYVVENPNYGNEYFVAIQSLLRDIFDIQEKFVKQRNKIQDLVEKKMNQILKSKDKGIGFDPTIRNIFAVILANAEVYIRLLKEVHYKSFQVGLERGKLLSGFSDESKNNESVYPWPEVKKQTANKQKVIAYPGDPDLQMKLQTYNKFIWPEIDFLENYQAVTTKRNDSLTKNEGSSSKVEFVFDSDARFDNLNKISTSFQIQTNNPYTNKSISSVLYEIYERCRYTILSEEFNNQTIQELADNEFKNIQTIFEEDYDIIGVLKQVTSVDTLESYMLSFSPFERYPYFQDKLPTIEYIKNIENKPFSIESIYSGTKNNENNTAFVNLNNDLKSYSYKDGNYRYHVYPFNSEHYLNYLDKTKLDENDLNLKSLFSVNTKEGLVSGPQLATLWVKPNKSKNLFEEKIKINDESGASILNTPYFHRQLFNDFSNGLNYGKYASSAYLLLNSLPFLDLEDEFDYGSGRTRLNTVFKEVAASHYVPYHLILKWGSLYHRYKKYLNEGIDILSGVTTPISGSTFFDNNSGLTYNVGSTTMNYTSNKVIGIHPFYESIYHQVVNGYTHYNVSSGVTDYNTQTSSGVINTIEQIVGNNGRYWTSFVDNSKTTNQNNWYTLLPSFGLTDTNSIAPLNYNDSEQAYLKILWCYDKETIKTSFSGKTFFNYNEYNRTYDSGRTFYDIIDFTTEFFSGTIKDKDNQYSLEIPSKRKITDLIATFSPQILDSFEECFLDFASERIEEEIPYKRFNDVEVTGVVNNETKVVNKYTVKHQRFQELLQSLSTIDKDSNTDVTDKNSLIDTLKTKQLKKLETVSAEILSQDNLIKLTMANPKEILPNVWYGFTKIDNVNRFDYGGNYSASQYTTGAGGTKNMIELYVGEDVDLHYRRFFEVNDIELNEENILQFRPLIHIFAGGYKDAKFTTKEQFQQYIITNVLNGISDRTETYLIQLLQNNFPKLKLKEGSNETTIFNGYNDTLLKLELYNFFKSFNDKWVAGNSIGQRTLLEEFLFLDKANKDIGDVAYLSLEKLLTLEDPRNDKANLYSVISMLIQNTGFDMRALPSYVNFYSNNNSLKTRQQPSKKIAKNMFGTFLDVDYQESSPKIIIQYVGPTSKHLELSDINKKYNFKNDSGNLFNGVGSPLVITTPNVFSDTELLKSNRVVAFEVSVGDQNQGIFKSVQLDQTSIRNTTESFNVMENLGRSESGAGANQIDIGLFDIYRQASYTCDVTCMGNVMIQPTMYFYLKNVPLFRGSYWITEVAHNIKNNNITTSFKGTRIPMASLPDPKDSFLASYRVLFDKVTRTAVAKVKEEQNSTTTSADNKEQTFTTNDGLTFTSDLGGKTIPSETILYEQGVTQYGVPYNGWNGEKYIQKVKNNGKEYLRAQVVCMGAQNYPIEGTTSMSIITRQNTNTVTPNPMTWNDIKDSNNYFYSLRFDYNVANPNLIVQGKTKFYNPNNLKNAPIVIEPIGTTAITTSNIKGPINNGPSGVKSGIGMSKALMKALGVQDGDVVYFEIVKE